MVGQLWRGKTVLITGVAGTIGRELLRQIARREPGEIIGLDNNESELFFLGNAYRGERDIRFTLGDIRDSDGLVRKTKGVDIILHAAALKHVILCEESPQDAVFSNIIGTQNVIDAAMANEVEMVLFTSSDKAVNPTSVMGTSKLMCERLITAANVHRQNGGTRFASTRFGNVLGSRGSVIPLFKRQIAAGGPVTLTDTRMTRFIMSLEDAVSLVMESASIAKGGEVLVTKMSVVRIDDLAEVMIEECAGRYGYKPSDISIEVIGSKAGEKMYEELVNEEEMRRTVDLEKYFAVTPAIKSIYDDIDYEYQGASNKRLERPYNSAVETPMEKEELRHYLANNGLFDVEA